MEARRRVQELRELIHIRGALRADGWSGERIAAAVRRDDLVRVGRARYVHGEAWARLYPEDRLLVRVLANAPAQGERAVFCAESAAVLHGLPLYRAKTARAQVICQNAPTVHSSGFVHRRTAHLDSAEIMCDSGIRYTSLVRTIADLVRYTDPLLALVCADAAAAQVVVRLPRHHRATAAESWKNEVRASLDRNPGGRGVRRGLALVDRVDPGAESPLETVGRFRCQELGFVVNTQIRVRGPNGASYFVDLELVGLGVLCEIDGAVKYSDPEMLRGMTAAQAVRVEKAREDWIRGVTGTRVIRLEAADLRTAGALAAKLRAFGIVVPRPPQ